MSKNSNDSVRFQEAADIIRVLFDVRVPKRRRQRLLERIAFNQKQPDPSGLHFVLRDDIPSPLTIIRNSRWADPERPIKK